MVPPEKLRGLGRRNALIAGAGAAILAGRAPVFVRPSRVFYQREV
jgi:hypothetical protein